LEGHTSCIWSIAFHPTLPLLASGGNDKTAKVWDATTGAELLALKGHTESVNSAQFSPDGNRIVTAGGNIAKVWDARPYSESFVEREAAEAKR
jgi:WD40 repeat protein